MVEEAHPDLSEAHECFHVLRAFDFAISKAALLRTKRDQLKPEVIWNIEEGLKLTVEQLERAEAQRVAMSARTLEFFKSWDLLLTPATIVAPFPIEHRYVAECAGKKFDNYVEWLVLSTRSRWCAARRCRCPAGSPQAACRSDCRWWRRRAARPSFLPARKCWRTFWALRGTTPIDPRPAIRISTVRSRCPAAHLRCPVRRLDHEHDRSQAPLRAGMTCLTPILGAGGQMPASL